MQNGTIIQFFHWYYPVGGKLWNHFKEQSERLASLGITAAWLPPATKGSMGAHSVGYDIYDLFDLGEFDQKASVETKYGSKQEYIDAIQTANSHNIAVFADVVFNHKAGGDETEKVKVIKVNPDNRLEEISEELEIEAYTKFTFPARKGKYSSFVWDYRCFTGTDYNASTSEEGIFLIVNDYTVDGWKEVPTLEMGNYDYLMFTDVEFRNPAVKEELKYWAKWYYETVKYDGLRLDALKHIPVDFFNEWIDFIKTEVKEDVFVVGECWTHTEPEMLDYYIQRSEGRMQLFDSPLQFNFYQASKSGNDYDLSKIFENSLVNLHPALAVTFVANHDTQPLQSLEAAVEPWFKPLAYAMILLREHGYPCIFYPDLYGAHYVDKGRDGNDYEIWMPVVESIEQLLEIRRDKAFGLQRDYMDHPNCIGWTREGIDDKPGSGCAVVLSNGDEGVKDMEMGAQHAGKIFIDYLGKHTGSVIINEEGWGKFFSPPGGVSVWVEQGN